MPIQSYLEGKYADTKKSITELSKNDDGKALVKHTNCMYCFDEISASIHGDDNVPTSTDAIFCQGNTIYLVEFKTGFKRRITRENFNNAYAACEHTPNVTCEHFKELIIKVGDLEQEILKDSLKMKALESYMTLEKWIFKECNLERNRVAINLIFVTDAPSDDIMMPSSSTSTNASLQFLEDSLSRFRIKKDFQKKKHLYDTVQVLSPKTFQNRINSNIIPTLHT